MSSIDSYIKNLLVTNQVSESELVTTIKLLKLYSPLLRQCIARIDEDSLECYASRRQSVADFINLAIDYNHDQACHRLTERLELTGRAIPFFEIMDTALLRVQSDCLHGDLYYRILRHRYFDKFCKSNEAASAAAHISSATFYRHIKGAQRAFSAILWHIVVPDFVLAYGHKGLAGSDISSAADAPLSAC